MKHVGMIVLLALPCVGVLDLSNAKPRVEWTAVAGDGEGDAVADHWHVFAHGRHWLSCSTPGARRSRLVALDADLRQVGSWKVADDVKGGPPEGMPADMGDIVRYVVGAGGEVSAPETLAEGEFARPHTLLAKDRLITTWDGDGGVWIRVDRTR